MKLLTADLKKKLTKAGYDNMKPICKLFMPWGRATWLITGMDRNGVLYGFADLGMGCVEWGGIESLEGLEAIRGPFGMKIERDLYWTPSEQEVEYCRMESLAGA